MKLTNEGFEVGTFTGLWVDDERPIPEDLIEKGWTASRDAWEAITKLRLINFEEISLDHDLASFMGYKEITGYDIAVWLADRAQQGLYVPPKVYVHSANPVGRARIQGVIDQYLTKR